MEYLPQNAQMSAEIFRVDPRDPRSNSPRITRIGTDYIGYLVCFTTLRTATPSGVSIRKV